MQNIHVTHFLHCLSERRSLLSDNHQATKTRFEQRFCYKAWLNSKFAQTIPLVSEVVESHVESIQSCMA